MKTLRVLLLLLVPSAIAWAQPVISTSSLPGGNVSVAYNASFACSSCQGYSWSVTSGFPPGLSVNSSSGAITGTPTTSGFFSFTVSLSNGQSTVTRNLSISIGAAPFSITTTSLPSGTVGTFYSQNITATGGFSPYFFSITAGALPAGLGLSGATISGTPTTATSGAAFTIRGTDSSGQQSTANLSIAIAPIQAPAAITTKALPNGQINQTYAAQLTCTNCANLSWGVTNGALPPGIGVNAQTGALSGTPTSIGAFSFQMSLFGGNGVVTSASLSITVTGPGAVITSTNLPNGVLGQSYSAQLTCSNCSGWTWALTSGNLPNGLNFSASGGISGTPGILGGFPFQVTLSPPVGGSGSQTPVSASLSITIVSASLGIVQNTLPVAFQNTPYTTTLTGVGGTPPYTWALLSTANAGLTIGANTGILSGTPPASGTFSINVQITDSTGATAQKGFGFTVAVSLTILTSSLPNGSVGVAYPLQTLQAGGGQPPYRWSITTGALPAGITLDPIFGRISGTPTANGAFPFTLMVTDNQANTATANLSITVGAAVTITITPASLPAGTVGTAYTQTLTATGGTAPYSLAVTAGTLPAGLTFNGSTGVISGTPTTAATSNFTVTATDANQATGSAALSIVVAAKPAITITTTSLPAGTVAKAYSQTLAATGGTTPYTWSVSTGALPAGLTLNPSTGAITGTPTAAATSNFTVQVSDTNKLTAQQALSIVVGAAVTAIDVNPKTVTAVVGATVNQKLTVTGGTGPYTFSQGLGGGALGLSLDTAAGAITGKATTAGTGTINIIVADSSGSPGTPFQIVITVTNPPTPTVTVTLSGPSSGFAQQIPITVAIGSPYPLALTGVLSLTFAPSVTPSAGVDDLLIQFASGGRSISFTIPAGSTTPVFPAGTTPTVLTGTTAGTITVTTSLTSSGSPVATTTKTIVNASGVPFINPNGVSLTQSSGGVSVSVVGFSSTRDMTSALFHFAPATGVTLTQQDITVQLGPAFSTWWGNTAQSNPFGTEFTLTVPFTLSTQSTSIVSVTVTLTNSKGASNPVSSQ